MLDHAETVDARHHEVKHDGVERSSIQSLDRMLAVGCFDGAILKLVKIVLERENFTVEGVRNAAVAIDLLASVAYDLLIDLMLPEIGGEALLGFLEQTQPKYLRRVVVTTASPGRMSCEFLQRICRLLAKPFDIDELVLIAKECAQPDAA